jgi:hypothetical protein
VQGSPLWLLLVRYRREAELLCLRRAGVHIAADVIDAAEDSEGASLLQRVLTRPDTPPATSDEVVTLDKSQSGVLDELSRHGGSAAGVDVAAADASLIGASDSDGVREAAPRRPFGGGDHDPIAVVDISESADDRGTTDAAPTVPSPLAVASKPSVEVPSRTGDSAHTSAEVLSRAGPASGSAAALRSSDGVAASASDVGSVNVVQAVVAAALAGHLSTVDERLSAIEASVHRGRSRRRSSICSMVIRPLCRFAAVYIASCRVVSCVLCAGASSSSSLMTEMSDHLSLLRSEVATIRDSTMHLVSSTSSLSAMEVQQSRAAKELATLGDDVADVTRRLQKHAAAHETHVFDADARCARLELKADTVADDLIILKVRCVALRCVALRFVALRCVALRCVALRCVALRCVALRCTCTCARAML